MNADCGPTKSEILASFKFMVRKSLDFHILFINKGEIVVKQGRGGKELVERALPLLKDRYNELGYNYQITITEVKPPEQEPPSPIPVNPVSKGDEEPLNIEGKSLDKTSQRLVYDAAPSHEWKGLYFRSEQEVRVAKALDLLGVTFGPNTGLRVTEPDRRHTREVDFLVIIDGNVGVLEVDSKQYHDPEKDAIRDAIFKEQGIKFIKRYSYQECLDAQKVAINFVVEMQSFFNLLPSASYAGGGIEINPNDELICPGCGYQYLHHSSVEVFNRPEDSIRGNHITVDASETSKSVKKDTNMENNPSCRRGGILINFWCECCDAEPTLGVSQHKGVTLMEWQKPK